MPTRAALVVLGFWIAAAAMGNAAPAPQDIATKDRLSLTLADDGSVAKLRMDEKELPLMAAGGFFLQDMSRKFVPRDIPNQQCAYPGVALRGGAVERIAEGGLRVTDRLQTRPTHRKSQDPDDPLAAARSLEITSLWRLAAA